MRLSLAFTSAAYVGYRVGCRQGSRTPLEASNLGSSPVVNVRLTRERSAARKLARLLLDLGHNQSADRPSCQQLSQLSDLEGDAARFVLCQSAQGHPP